MDIIQLIPQVYEKFALYVLIFTRISAMLTTFVLLKRDLITGRIIIALSSILSIYVFLLYPPMQITYDMFSLQWLIHILFQALLGLVSGIILNIIFDVFVGVGQVISTQIGLGMASLIDPRFGYITSLTHFYMITTTLLFLYLNGHLFAIKTILDSFTVMPVNYAAIPSDLLHSVLIYAGIIFKGSVMLSITLVIVLLLTNITLAIMTKFAPQFNLFSIGINMELVLGLFCIYITYQLFVDHSMNLINECLNYFYQSLR
jgi:flagellar biosynthesis protein FliR